MFKKLVNLLFEEEEIEDFESEYEESEPVIEVRTKKAEPELPKKAEPVTLKEDKPKEETESVNETAEEKPAESKGIMIDLDPVKEPKVSVPKFTQKRETEYEFSQVISPIFGVIEDEKKTVSELSSPSVPKRKVVPNNSLLGTVISPIYGVTKDAKNPMTSSRVLKDDEVENVSLDDLLAKPDRHLEEELYAGESIQREEDPNDLDSLIRSLRESEPEKPAQHKIVESQLNLFGDEE